MIQDDTTYDLLVQGTRQRTVHYGCGIHHRWPPAMARSRPDRDIRVSRRDRCRCSEVRLQIAQLGPDITHVVQAYERDDRRRLRRQALGEAGLFSTTCDRALVDWRQARALAGVDVSAVDMEIARRILADPTAWGAVGSAMRRRLWVDEVLEDGENYVLH